MDFYDEIYATLIGDMQEEYALPWVPNALAPGSYCEESLTRLMDARDRLAERLGVDVDPDLEIMMDEMVAIQSTLCRMVMELRRL